MHLHLKKRKRVFERLILFTILFPLVFFLFSVLRLVAIQFFQFDVFTDLKATLILVVFLVTFLYKPADFFAILLLKNVVFKSNVKGQVALGQLVKDLSVVLEAGELSNVIVNTIGESFDVQNVSIMLYNKDRSTYKISSAYGLTPALWRSLELRAHHPLVELMKVRKAALDQSQIQKAFPWQEANMLTHAFETLHASCLIPLIFQDELLGSINLLPRCRPRTFSIHEIRALNDFAKEVARLFKSALLIEELKRNNQKLMEMHSQLLHTTQRSAIEHLATGLAHEIHNPLTIISGKAQVLLLKRNGKNDAQVEEVLKTIVKQTKRAADITRKLLMFSEPQKSAKAVVDLEEVVNDTIALLSYQVSLDQIQVVKRILQPIPKFLGNVGELREAFLNLFLNAVQAIGKQGVVEITLKYDEKDRAIELDVKDSGPGISEEHLPKVFHPFFTTRPDAIGLGLFVTQQIVHGYHGVIAVDSEAGKGSIFTVRLPVDVLKPGKEVSVKSKTTGKAVLPAAS